VLAHTWHRGHVMERGSDVAAEWQRARELFASAQRITALTGAGMSTSAGIPDFRGPNGVWTKNPAAQRLSDIDSYVSDPEVRRLAWQSRATHPAWDAVPSAAHRAFVDLHESGRLGAVLTQNIDELHQRAGLPRERVLELHGSLFGTVCLDCGATGSMRSALDRVAAGEEDPPCLDCGGILKSATVSFGQSLDQDVVRECHRATLNCDLFLAAGTSLTVYPAAGFAELATKAGADLVICNAEPTPYDGLAAAVLREPLDEVLPELVAVPRTEPARPLHTWADPSTWS
jgi:NAD-dependent deacetylase